MCNLPIVILIFILGKIIYRFCTIKTIMKLLRPFNFNLYFFVLLIEGNYQCFCYYFTSDLKTFFFFNKFMKIYNLIIIFTFYIFITILFAGVFIGVWHYSKIKWITLQTNKLKKCAYFLINTGIFNFTLGTIHSISYNVPKMQLFYLALG